MLDIFEDSLINSIGIISDFHFYNELNNILFDKYHKLDSIVVYSTPSDFLLGLKENDTFIKFTPNDFDELIRVNNIEHFNVNVYLFTESQKHHSYFNRKLFIDNTGVIRNYLGSSNSFGNISNITSKEDITNIINNPVFQEFWEVKKSDCDVCKDCEFRYMCIDNRVPIKRNSNQWYHEKECSYNPYIAKWKGEKSYLNLHDCGIVSDSKGFNIDKNKLG
jgi:hypothetical protein